MPTEKVKDGNEKKSIEEYIVNLLKNKNGMTTREILVKAELDGISCPDEPVRFLNKMRMKGLINGRVSQEEKGWIWWV